VRLQQEGERRGGGKAERRLFSQYNFKTRRFSATDSRPARPPYFVKGGRRAGRRPARLYVLANGLSHRRHAEARLSVFAPGLRHRPGGLHRAKDAVLYLKDNAGGFWFPIVGSQP